MAAADQPDATRASTDITASRPSSIRTEAISEKPSDALAPRRQKRPFDPTPHVQFLSRFDVVLLAMLLTLTFFVASHPVYNSDFYLRIALGRDLLNGSYSFGTDPYSWSTAGVYWVNHSWLYDVVLYLLYSSVGIAALIVLKALIVAATALVIVMIGRGRGSLWLPVVFTGLAVLTICPRLDLRPATISPLFLALTVWILVRRDREGDDKTAAVKPIAYWPLWPLFAIWANVDEWFVLGPITVALYFLGQWLQALRDGSSRPGKLSALGLGLVGGLAACLLNPHFHAVFALPAPLALTGAAAELKRDVEFSRSFGSAFNQDLYFPLSSPTISRAGVAFWPLLVLSVVALGIGFLKLHLGRALIFVFFLLLAGWSVQGLLFFAVTAAALAPLTLNAWATRATDPASLADPGWRSLLQFGRGLTFVVVLLLIGAAWPGWLHARQQWDRRRVAWTEELDPSLQETALWFKQMHEDGKLPADARGFNTSLEIAHALAWFCPQEKTFMDTRYALFGSAVADFRNMRKALFSRPPEATDVQVRQTDWEKVMAGHGVTHAIVQSTRETLSSPIYWLEVAGVERGESDWQLLYGDGRTMVYGWTRAHPELARLHVDHRRQALAARPEEQAPPDGLERFPQLYPFWEKYYVPPKPRSFEADRSAFHRLLARNRVKINRQRHEWLWRTLLAQGMCVQPPVMLLPITVTTAYEDLMQQFRRRERASASLFQLYAINELHTSVLPTDIYEQLLLAIRHGRRAAADNPDAYITHLQLGMAYKELLAYAREERWAALLVASEYHFGMQNVGPQLLSQLRQIQAVTALNLALMAEHEQGLEIVHSQLAEIYLRNFTPDANGVPHFGYQDLALQHLQAAVKLTRQEVRRSGAESDRQALAQDEQQVTKLAQDVEQLRSRYNTRKHRLTTIPLQARELFDLGLAGEALKLLLSADETQLGPDGLNMLFELALNTGQVQVLRDRYLHLDLKRIFGPQKDLWLRALVAASLGNYVLADEKLRSLTRIYAEEQGAAQLFQAAGIGMRVRPLIQPDVRQITALLIGKGMMDALKPRQLLLAPVIPHLTLPDMNITLIELIVQALRTRLEETTIHVVRGMLWLEQGDAVKARVAFEQAKKIADGLLSPEVARALPPRMIAEEFLKRLDAVGVK